MVCNYCGQVLMEDAECNCPEAIQERKTQNQIRKAKEVIREIFGEGCASGSKPVLEDNIEMLEAAAELIANYKMYAVSFLFPEGIKAKLTRSAKGSIKVERTEVKKDGLEVPE